MAKGSGGTRQHSAQEWKGYFAMQRAGALENLASGVYTEDEYNARIMILAQREEKFLGTRTISDSVKAGIEKRVENDLKKIEDSNAIVYIRNIMDKAIEDRDEGVLSETQADRIINLGKKKINSIRYNYGKSKWNDES